jgi:hypothetical protein
MRRSTLVSALGYGNLNKGCRRLLTWERGEHMPTSEQLLMLRDALGVGASAWDEQMEVLEAAAMYKRADWLIQRQTRALLACHYERLLDHADAINVIPSWRHIHLPGLTMGLMYVRGSTYIPLGGLIAAWRSGALCADTEDGRFFAMTGGGSPLTGTQRFMGFIEGQSEVQWRSDVHLIGPLVSSIPTWRTLSQTKSSWSLPQFLAQLGVEIPPARIWCHGDERGSYDFHRAVLTWDGTEVAFPLGLDDAATAVELDMQVTEERQPHRKRLVIDDLLAGKSGAWNGERWTVEAAGGSWQIRPGCAENPQGYPVLRWDRELPPLVGAWIVRLRADP